MATCSLTIVFVSILVACSSASRNPTIGGHEMVIPVPMVSSPHLPQSSIPGECRNPLVETYILALQAGTVDFETIEANASISATQRFCKTLDDGAVIEARGCDPSKAPVGFLWRELSDSPIVIGILKAGGTDNNPHFHAEEECYYAVDGRARTLARDGLRWMEKGQYFYVPGNTIHNTVMEPGFLLLYWYPKNAHFDSFKYFWRKDVKGSKPADMAFERADEIRRKALNTSSR